jgi:glycosyltransferase involved in cell wall biosynthesis
MGKNMKKKTKQNDKSISREINDGLVDNIDIDKDYPFVSVCTPTFNRRPFISATIKCFQNQTYPKERIEWIIIDDGTDPIEDLVKHIQGVKYFRFNKKMTLGKKRNLMHEKSKGDIIVYMDDDDYYPPNRVSHAVDKLNASPGILCAGSSQMFIWFNDTREMWQFGPYGDNHATAGTFAFRRELLKTTGYNNSASIAEEREFLKGYTTPIVQLDSEKVILCFSHLHNTFDKKNLLKNPNPQFVKKVNFKVEDFIKEPDLLHFYTNELLGLLKKYDLGKPEIKEDVISQMKELEFRKQVEIEKIKSMNEKDMNYNKNSNSNSIVFTVQEEGKPPENIQMSNEEIVEYIKHQIGENEMLKLKLMEYENKIKQKDAFISVLTNKIKSFQKNINTNSNAIPGNHNEKILIDDKIKFTII